MTTFWWMIVDNPDANPPEVSNLFLRSSLDVSIGLRRNYNGSGAKPRRGNATVVAAAI